MTLIPPPGERALPLLSGALLALAHPPAPLLLPGFVGLAPLLVFIAERPPGPPGRWAATRGGLVTGLVYFGLQLYWILVALLYHSVLAIPAYLGAVLVLAGLAGAFAWAAHRSLERLRLPLWLVAAVLWTTIEWIQAHLGPLAFPWLGLGTALAPYPVLAGAADLVGSRGLTAWLAALNGLLATLLVRWRMGAGAGAGAGAGVGIGAAAPSPWPLVAALVLGVAGPAAYGGWRAATLRPRPVARVVLVQPNIPEELKLDRRVALDTSLAALTALTARGLPATDSPIDLVVWPEVALPATFAAGGALADTVRGLSRSVGAPILVGAYGLGGGGGDRGERGGVAYNSAFLVDAGGPRGTRYDKRRLVPFVERVPFIDPVVLERITGDARYYGGLARGGGTALLRTDSGGAFGVLICYESIFADLAREHRAAGADFLVNITNDAWYGREPWYARTTALWQHPAHLVLRAIETRVGVARAANTGISMIIDPLGRTHHATPLFEPAVRTGVVQTTDGLTLFVRWGDWLAGLAVAAAAVFLVAGAARGRGGLTGG